MPIVLTKPQYQLLDPGWHDGGLLAIVDKGFVDYGQGPRHMLELNFYYRSETCPKRSTARNSLLVFCYLAQKKQTLRHRHRVAGHRARHPKPR